ncbi:hypothetical protein AAIH74_33260, partial [Pseudomonas aeruginosa]
ALGADGGHGHAQPPFRSSRLIGAERQPTSDCRQSLQQSPFVDRVSEVRFVRDGKVHVDLNHWTATTIYDEGETVQVIQSRKA